MTNDNSTTTTKPWAQDLARRVWDACGRVSTAAQALHEQAERTSGDPGRHLEAQAQGLLDASAIIAAEVIRWRDEPDPGDPA